MEYRHLDLLEVCELLTRFSSYKLLMHSSPDGDTLGSCTALAHLLMKMNKSVYIVRAEEAFPEHLEPFCSVRTYSPEEAREIETDAVVSVDVASPSQLRYNREIYDRRVTFMIDHHENGTPFADNYVRPNAAATGEIVFEIADALVQRKDIDTIPIEAAEALYLSIISDTGGFKYSNTTPKTHIYAARLIELGVRGAYISKMCFDSKSPAQIEAEKITYNNLRILLDGKLVIAALDSKTKNGLKNEYFENAVNIARSVKGALVSCSLKEKDDTPGDWRVSLRSGVGGPDVSKICAEFGGGGHVCAAGCSILADDVEKAVCIITEKVGEVLSV